MENLENVNFRIYQKRIFFELLLVPFIFLLAALPVAAHHPLDSQLESFNLFQGLISGLFHPIIGLDHLIFLLSVGLLGRLSHFTRIPLLLAFGLFGSIASQFLPIFPGSEIVMGLSIGCSVFVAFSKLPSLLIPLLIFIHGFVMGNAMIGVEPTPLVAYFVGLLVVEVLIIFLGRVVIQRFLQYRKILLAMVLGVGLTITTSAIL